MTSGTETRNNHIQLVQYNKQLQALLNQMKHKTEIYELGIGNISRILKELPNELQFKVLTSADRLRSSFSLTTHLIMQKKALDKIERVVDEIQTSMSYKGVFAGLSASSRNRPDATQQQPCDGIQINLQPNITVTALAELEAQAAAKISVPTSTLSIQKSVIKAMPPAPPPPRITKHTVSPAVIHMDSKEIQIQIEANPIDRHAAFLENDIIFRGEQHFATHLGKFPKLEFDSDDFFIRRRGRGRPPTRIPGYSSSSSSKGHGHRNRDQRNTNTSSRRNEGDFRLKESEEFAREDDMAWQCLERVYASHRVTSDGTTSGSFNISQILENAPITLSADEAHPHRFPRSQSVSPFLLNSNKHAS